jgi:hypothetical protein
MNDPDGKLLEKYIAVAAITGLYQAAFARFRLSERIATDNKVPPKDGAAADAKILLALKRELALCLYEGGQIEQALTFHLLIGELLPRMRQALDEIKEKSNEQAT